MHPAPTPAETPPVAEAAARVAATRSIVLVGMPGAGKSSIGRRIATRLNLPFLDADTEIEAAAGLPITEIFTRYGEPHFRDGERRVIARLLAGPPLVLATGGGAFSDARTRAAVAESGALAVWLRCSLPVLLRRVAGREHRPLFLNRDPREVLERLMTARHPTFAEAPVIVDCTDEPPETTTRRVMDAVAQHRDPARLPVRLGDRSYDILVGEGLLPRAGALIAPWLPARRVVIITDETVATIHLPTLTAGLAEAGVGFVTVISVPPGEASKSFARLQSVLDAALSAGADRRTAVVALGGGVVGDLAGFAAAVALRGLPFIQIPTTLLAQVDSSVGGKTGINTAQGKNLVGAFHQPRLVLADTGVLATLPPRELRAGYAEVAKHGLLQGALWAWCEAEGAKAVAGDQSALAHAVLESCRLKSAVVASDEREESEEGGRALLNLGHTFGHAIEATAGYGTYLHGEAVAIGLVMAARLSAELKHCTATQAEQVEATLKSHALPTALRSALPLEPMLAAMRRDKKVRGGKLRFVLQDGIGAASTADTVPEEAAVRALLAGGAVR